MEDEGTPYRVEKLPNIDIPNVLNLHVDSFRTWPDASYNTVCGISAGLQQQH
jgi:hypothetical protein